jgi:hypothetical protein
VDEQGIKGFYFVKIMSGFYINRTPNIPLSNPFLIRVQLVEKQEMRQQIAFYYGETFAEWMMRFVQPVVYLVVAYGTEWTCTIYVLY